MATSQEDNLIVGLDIGTSKVVAIVGEYNDEGEIDIIGFGYHKSRGLKKGVVVDINATVDSIRRAISEAETMAGCSIHGVYAGIAGSHIRSYNSQGVVAIKEREVSQMDIDRVIESAKALALPADQLILHTLPQEYLIDSQDGVREPLGMSGVRMEAKVHLVTGAQTAAQNIIKCIEKCNLEVEELVLEQLASSYAVLTQDEKDLGVCLVDIGGGTSDIAVFSQGGVQYTANIPVAGDQVTSDIAHALRTPTKHAEEIKMKYACALTELAREDETIKVPSVGDREPRDLSRLTLAEVVEPRYEELFMLIQRELRRAGYEDLLPAGIVLTGGTAKMEGVVELAESIFHLPVRLGSPSGMKGMTDIMDNPIYSTGVGLIQFGVENRLNEISDTQTSGPGVWARIKDWMASNV
ncbi:MAG: cell division protein FtsA [Pseudomonadales bacterium]|jgi:cell division protein FtsA|uniref:Cell division protein FtsA n=1 Tax=Umboniibacter marinipuniceus TaxID=569599 RepID=A0A3M0A8J9_9GAMM|nr:cell division protein FtsA [Umboniibacter marinipuniceus]RMA81433.1 cell division protein FtsA [Umboniibacter marinipuniceus]